MIRHLKISISILGSIISHHRLRFAAALITGIFCVFSVVASAVSFSPTPNNPSFPAEYLLAPATGRTTVDTQILQNAVNRVSANGGGVVRGYPGSTYIWGQVTPAANVIVWLYGCTISIDPTAIQAMFYWNTASALPSFKLRGGTFVGTGAETTNQAILQVNNPGFGGNIEVRDTIVTGWATGSFYFGNVVRAKAIHNTILNSCTPTGTNAINFVSQLTNGVVQECIATHNIIENCQTFGIAYVNTGTTINTECRVIITDNYCSGNATSGNGSGGIDIEFSSAGIAEGSKFVVANNICDFTGSISAKCITINGSSNAADGAMVNRVSVTGNIISSTSVGLLLEGSYITCTGNFVDAVVQGVATGKTTAAPNVGVSIVGNVIHMPTTATNNAINADGLNDSLIAKNIVLYDSGQTNTTGTGINVNHFNRVRVINNHIAFSPGNGITFSNGTDFEAKGNYIRNPQDGQLAPTGAGISLAATVAVGVMQRIYGNTIVDDRGTHKMFYGIDCNSIATAADVRNNRISGWSNAAVNNATTRLGNQLSNGASAGRAVLVAGTSGAINTTEIQAADNVLLTVVVPGGTRGEVQLGAIVAGTSFVINSIQPGTASTLQAADTSTVYWKIEH